MNRELYPRPAGAALGELAGRINAAHEEAEAAARTCLERVRAAGLLLLEARGRLPHGRWLPWVAENLRFTDRQARKYMAVARGWGALAESEPGSDLTLRDALHRIAAARRAELRAGKRRELERKAAAAPPAGPDTARVMEGDCLEELPKVGAGSVRLVFADPPYNLGVDYGEGAGADRLREEEYLGAMRRRLEAASRLLTPDGSLWVLVDAGHSADFVLMLRGLRLHQRAFITWYETFGVNCTGKFNRCSRHLLHFVKDPTRFVFHPDAVRRASARQTDYNDKRADPWGKVWDDVWGVDPPIPRLNDNSPERVPGFPTQLPLDLLRPIIGCATDPDDLVVDPFSGSATTGVACLALGRRYVGIEKNKEYVRLSRQRLAGALAPAPPAP